MTMLDLSDPSTVNITDDGTDTCSVRLPETVQFASIRDS